jgi:phospholipid transport system substrate-binding protein
MSPVRANLKSLATAAALGLAAVAPLCVVATPAAAQAIRSHGDPSAEAFVQQQVSQALHILADRSLPVAQKKQDFYAFVNQVADVPRITDFVLGRYRRQITPAQYQQFAQAFRAYADSVYESRIGAYSGETLTVTGSVVRAPGDVVVSSLVQGGDYKGMPVVNWRLIRGPDGWKVVDVQAQGVWLAIVEQQDFTSTLANNNGNIGVLIAQLKRDAAHPEAAKARG